MPATLLTRKIRAQQAVVWGADLLRSILGFLPIGLGLVLLFGASALLFVHTPSTAFFLDAVLLSSMAGVLASQCARLWKTAGDPVCVAKALEQKDAALRSDLSNALQFLKAGSPESASAGFVQLAIAKGGEAASSLRWNRYRPPIMPSLWSVRASCILGCGILALAFSSPLARRSVFGLAHPSSLSANTRPLHVIPGNAVVVSGDSLVVTVIDRNGEVLEWNASVTGLASAAFRYHSRDSATLVLPRVNKPFSYSVKTLRRSSPTFAVRVLDRPRIEELHVTLHYPAYTRRSPAALEPDLGDFSAPLGSRAEIRLLANKRLRDGKLLILPDSTQVPLVIRGKEGQATLRVRGNAEYEILVVDTDSLRSSNGIRYRVGVVDDMPPSVVLQQPAEDLVLDRSMQVELAAAVQDDYGLSALRLHYKIQSEDGPAPEDSSALGSSHPGGRSDTVKITWDLRKLSLYPGDEIQFWVKAWDNDAIHGPKAGQSLVRKARFPSLKEILAQAQKDEEKAISDLTSARQEQERLEKETENLQQKIQSKPPGPKEAARLDQLQNEQANLVRDIDSLAQNIAEQLANQLSDESMRASVEQRMNELRNQVEMLRKSKFAQAFEKMEKLSAQPDMARLKQMLEQTAREQHDLTEQLDRMLDMLKQLQAQNRLEDLAAQLSQMADQQDSLRKEAERNPDKASETARRQERLAQDLENLQKEMQAAENDSAFESAMQEALRSLNEELKNDSTGGRMRSAASQLSQGQMSMAGGNQKRASAALRKAGSRMSAMASKMRGQSMERLVVELRAIADQLLQVSFDAESLAVGTQRPGLVKAAVVAGELEAAAGGLVELDRTLGYSDPVVMRHLSNAITHSRSLAAGRTEASWPVVEATNRAVMRLHQQLAQLGMMSAKGGMSLDKLMSGMMGMGAEQMMLNQMMRSMLESAMRGGTKPGRGETGRMAAEQRSLMERYEEMRRAIQNRPDRPFDAPDLREPMQEVIRDIESGSMDQATLQKQDNILSRMLDGNLSLQQRDFSKKRLAEIERRNLERAAPPLLVPEELRRLKAGNTRYSDYPSEYHDRIRAYLQESTK